MFCGYRMTRASKEYSYGRPGLLVIKQFAEQYS
jgi:hypothetical protein